MKRRILIFVVLALLLAGCTGNTPDTTLSTGGTLPGASAPTEQTVPSAPAEGLYDPDAAVTALSEGALAAYPLEDGHLGIIPVDGGLLLVRNDYCGDTILGLFSAETGTVTARRDLNTLVAWDEGVLTAAGERVYYFDKEDRSVVTLDGSLSEISRVILPEDMEDMPLLSANGSAVYYHTGRQIRALDMQAGISRLLRDHDGDLLALAGLYLEDTVLKVYTDDTEEMIRTQYLSTQNGETLHYGDDTLSLVAKGDSFCAELGSGYASELLYGQIGGEVQMLDLPGTQLWCRWLPGMGGAVHCVSGDGSWTMNYYDLASGKRTASLTLPDSGSVHSLTEDGQGNIWLLYSDEDSGLQTLCRWDLSKSGVSDGQVYTGRRYTAEDPDTEGLTACQAEADRIGETYGVEILLWKDVQETLPEDYSFRTEYRVDAISRSLKILEKAMARFPEGFFQTAAKLSDTGKIRISLVSAIQGSRERGTLPVNDGIQYWDGGDPYIALQTGADVEMSFYHQMFHVMETRVLGKTVIYDDWEKLNPKGFSYDYDYYTNQERKDTKYLEGENRAFADLYSMSYPREDRARIMEYAMMEGNEEVFASDWMQRKLQRLCRGIRKAFGLSKFEEVLPWEVYLEESLVP